jgi:hypothetical protein
MFGTTMEAETVTVLADVLTEMLGPEMPAILAVLIENTFWAVEVIVADTPLPLAAPAFAAASQAIWSLRFCDNPKELSTANPSMRNRGSKESPTNTRTPPRSPRRKDFITLKMLSIILFNPFKKHPFLFSGRFYARISS